MNSRSNEAAARSDKSAALKAIQRQAKARRLRTMIGVIVLVVLLVLNVALSVTALLVSLDSNARAQATHNSVVQTLKIARGFQCQQDPTTKGCPPVKSTQASNAGSTQGLVDQIVWRVEAALARAAGASPPPRPADVPPSIMP